MRVGLVFAQQAQPDPKTIPLTDPIDVQTVPELISKITTYVWQISIPVITLMVIWGGWQILTAGDDSSKVTKGKDTLKWAVIGAAVILVAQGLVFVVTSLFGVDESQIKL